MKTRLHYVLSRNSNQGMDLKTGWMVILIILTFLVFGQNVQGLTRYSVATGNWNSNNTWASSSGGTAGASFPVAGDVVYIENGHTVTVTADAYAASVTFTGLSATLTVNSGFSVNVTGAITLNHNTNNNTTCYLEGSGTIYCASVSVGTQLSLNVNALLAAMYVRVTAFDISGDVTLNAKNSGSFYGQTSFRIESGTTTVGGQIVSNVLTGCTGTVRTTTGIASGTLKFTSATPWGSLSNVTLYLNGTSATVEHAGSTSPSVYNTTYQNLLISTTGVATFAGSTTVSGTTTINSGSTLATSNTFTANGAVNVSGSFQINQGGWATGSGTWSYSNGTLVFNNSSGSYGINNTDVYWPSSNSPANLNVKGAGGITLNSGANRTVTGTFQTAGPVTLSSATLTLNGTCQINSGGSFASSPTYGSSSILKYNTGGAFTRSNEWTTATSGAGYPANVQISNPGTATTLNMSTTSAKCAGNLTVDASTTLNTTSGGLTVVGNVAVNGTIVLGGDMYVAGDWTIGSSATQTNNTKAVFFNAATGNQTITKTGGGTVYFDYLVIDKATSGNIVFNNSPGTDVTINTGTSTSANVLQLINNGGLDLNSRTLTMNTSGGSIYVNGSRTITSGISGGKIEINQYKNVANNSGTGNLVIGANVTVNLNANGNLDFGKSGSNYITTLDGTLSINSATSCFVNTNPPIYGSGSLLKYNCGSTYTRSVEWSTISGAGYPYNVQLSTLSTSLNMGTTEAKCAGSITIDASTTVNTTSGGLTVVGSVSSNGTINLGGDVYVAGDWTIGSSGTQTNNSKAVFFNAATGNQTITKSGGGSIDFAYLVIDKSTSGNVILSSSPATDISISGTSGSVLDLRNTGGLDLNGRSLNLTGNGGNILVTGAARTISATGSGNFNIQGTKTVTSASSGSLVFSSTVTVKSTGTNVNFGTGLTTINGIFELAGGSIYPGGAPIYSSTSLLKYSTGATTYKGYEWTTASSGAGYPNNVQISATGTNLIIMLENSNCAGSLTIDQSTTLYPNSSNLTVGGDVVVNGTFTLGGTVYIQGNWTIGLNGSQTSSTNTGAYFNAATGNQTITNNGAGTANFYYLTVNKATSGDVVLANDITVTGRLTLTKGLITSGSNKIVTIGSSGTITGGNATSYVDGKLARAWANNATGSKTFPIGKGGIYRPVTLNYSALSGTSTVTAEQTESVIPGSTPSNTTLSGSRYWTLTETGSTSRTFTVTLDGTGFSPTHTAKMIKGDGTTNTASDVSFSTPYYTNTTGFTTFSNFALGEASIATTTSPDDKSACYGSTSVDLTATIAPNPGGGSVQFYIDGSTVGSPASVNAGTGVATLTYNPAALSAGNHTIRADFGGYGDYLSSTSNPGNNKTLTINTGVWIGGTSTDWSNNANWCGGIPGGTTNVTIPSGTTFAPHVDYDPASPAVCNNLTINSGASLYVDAGKALTANGNTVTNNGLYLKSPSGLGATGSFWPKGTITGNVNIERYIPGWTSSADGWYMLSSPVSGQAISPDFISATAANYDFYRWDETAASTAWKNYKQGGFTTFTTGEGYLVAYASSDAGIKNFSGSLNNLDQTSNNLSYSTTYKGWHLLGNPYTCALTWNDGNWGLTNMEAIAQILNSGGTYTPISAGGIIPAMNGFFVKATSATNGITIPLAARTHSSTNWYKNTEANRQLTVTVSSDENTTYVETIIGLKADATSDFDLNYDGHFMKGIEAAPELYSIIANSEKLCVNTLPASGSVRDVNLGFAKGLSVNYTFKASGLETFNPGVTITLEDKKTGMNQELSQNPNYHFTSTDGDNTNRFVLHFGGTYQIGEHSGNSFNITHQNGNITITSTNGNQFSGDVAVFNMVGQKVATGDLTGGQCRINGEFPTGYYIVQIVTRETTHSSKIFIK